MPFACPLLAVIVTAAQPAPAATPPLDTLVGLWTARRRFGPDARGTLRIERTGTAYAADLMGWRVPVALERGELTFTLPNGQGAFRGKHWPGGGIRGFWQPARSVAMGGHHTPVRLQPDGDGRWIGEITPFDDGFTFHLLVKSAAGGSLPVLLRNAERDFGALLGVSRLVREGDTVKLLGTRLGQTRETVAATGWYDAESDVLTLRFPSRGGSYDFRRAGDSSEFYPRGRFPGPYVYRPPPARDDGWPVGTLDEAGIERAAIEAAVRTLTGLAMDSLNAPQVHSLLIARHGRLVLEEYFHSEHRAKLHDTRSGSKSATAVLIGAAIQAGLPIQLSSPVYQTMNPGPLPAELDPRKRAMTLEHLLIMSSGLFCDDGNPEAPGNESNVGNQSKEPDYYRYTLQVPMATAPGEKAVYCSVNPNLALGVLDRATGESPFYHFERLVAEPLRIRRYAWATDPAGQPFGGGSMQLLPRDFMKLGQLMLNGGTWEGRQILSRDFVARATTIQSRLGSRNRGYGYLWWLEEYPYRGRMLSSYAALGLGGQLVIAFPEVDLVIGMQGGSYASNGWRYAGGEFIPKYILTAVR